jgi:hypothetical protein
MYVNREHKFLYLAHPKTGSTATAEALKNQLGFPNTHDHHGRLSDAEKRYDIETDEDWVICTTVRNHFDAVVSWFSPIITEYFTADVLESAMRNSLYWFPQQGSYYTAWHLEAANFVIEYENVQTELNEALRTAGLGCVEIPYTNPTRERTSRNHYSEWYKPSGVEYIRDTYTQELNHLGYEFQSNSTR